MHRQLPITGKYNYVFDDQKLRVNLRVSKNKLRVKLRVMNIIKNLRVKLRDKLRVMSTWFF